FLDKKVPKLGSLSGVMLTSAFAGCSGALARGILLCGTATARVLVRGLHPHLPRVMEALSEQDRRGAPLAHWIVDFALLAECIGTPRPPGFDSSLLSPLLSTREEFSDARRRAMALTALALGDGATALAFLDEKPATYDAPRVRFEFNQFELIRYLAAALDQRRPADWIEPSWVEYFTLFPTHISAQAAEWPDPFKVMRVLANVRGDKVSDIADDLHARVQLLAKQGK
ncbi:MAG TPA: hypothetical protein VFV94_07265, partial [Polyangiaceae bacterium]|nr:hypothetical protein [Polyangiaceae bacterium]